MVRDIDNSYLNLLINDKDSLLQLQGASVSYRIALGPQQGQKVFTLQTLPASSEEENSTKFDKVQCNQSDLANAIKS